MTTANPLDDAAEATAAADAGVVRPGTPPLRDALDRPLTSYYLLLGASALLLTIGLIMVLERVERLLLTSRTTATPTPSSSAS